jgi:hypothetical protein
MSSSKKIDLQRDFAAGVYLTEDQNPIPNSPPLTHCIRLYSILTVFTQERGGGAQPERRRKGKQFTKLGRKYQHD